MDRISDSGSDGLGSNPDGSTNRDTNAKKRVTKVDGLISHPPSFIVAELRAARHRSSERLRSQFCDLLHSSPSHNLNLSGKTALFVDKMQKRQHLSTKTGVFVDKSPIFGAQRPKGFGEYAPQLNFSSLQRSE